MKSNHGFHYHIKKTCILNFEMTSLFDLDQSIDTLCEFFGDGDQDNSLAEEYCPYFGVLWEAGIGLSQYLLGMNVSDKRVLEIGCGLALPSFVISKMGGDVLATDFHADVPLFLEINQRENQVFFPYKVMNWRNETDRMRGDLGQFDLVIGSDILYESQHPLQVAKALIALLKPGGKIILSDPGRAYIQKFITAMNDCGHREKLSSETVLAKYSPKNCNRDIFIFEFS